MGTEDLIEFIKKFIIRSSILRWTALYVTITNVNPFAAFFAYDMTNINSSIPFSTRHVHVAFAAT